MQGTRQADGSPSDEVCRADCNRTAKTYSGISSPRSHQSSLSGTHNLCIAFASGRFRTEPEAARTVKTCQVRVSLINANGEEIGSQRSSMRMLGNSDEILKAFSEEVPREESLDAPEKGEQCIRRSEYELV